MAYSQHHSQINKQNTHKNTQIKTARHMIQQAATTHSVTMLTAHTQKTTKNGNDPQKSRTTTNEQQPANISSYIQHEIPSKDARIKSHTSLPRTLKFDKDI